MFCMHMCLVLMILKYNISFFKNVGCACLCLCVCMCICVFVSRCACVFGCVCACVCLGVDLCLCLQVDVCLSVSVCVCVRRCVHVCVCYYHRHNKSLSSRVAPDIEGDTVSTEREHHAFIIDLHFIVLVFLEKFIYISFFGRVQGSGDDCQQWRRDVKAVIQE